MKYNIFLILFTGIFFFLALPNITCAANQQDVLTMQEQILALQEKIKELQLLIANATFQKEIKASSYLAIDISNNTVILERGEGQQYPIASITKLMNAVVTLENIDTNKTITLTKEMLLPEGYSPSIFLNLNISAKNLLNACLIQSTNDAAQSLTYFIGNKTFLSLMNKKAKELGMNNTYYYDATGLNPANHSTSEDLSKLVTYIYKKHPEILTITKDNDFWLPDPSGRLLKFQNLNNFSLLPDFIGGKTGYLPEAKQSLASLFSINGREVAIIILHSTNRQTDTLHIVDWIKNNAKVI